MSDDFYLDRRSHVKGAAYEAAYPHVNVHLDRLKPYRDWHRTLGKDLYCMDIDQLEYRIIDDVFTPVAIIEMSLIETEHEIGRGYCQKAWDRAWNRDPQLRIAANVSTAINVPGYFVLLRPDLSVFWVRMFSPSTSYPESQWRPMLSPVYAEWLRSLGTGS